MSFWGLSSTGKNAQGRLGELPNWGYGQMKDSLGRSNDQYGLATGNQGAYQNYLQGAMQNGFGDPNAIRQWGQQAMPGVDQAMQSSRDAYGNVQSPGTTNQQQGSNLDTLQNSYNNTYNTLQGVNRDAFNQQGGNLNQANQDYLSSIQGAYGGAASNANSTYGYLRGAGSDTFNNLRGQNSGLYSGLIDKSNRAYGNATNNVQRLLPGGDLRAAATAQAYAPNISATNRRIRASGVDPNSGEASEQLQNAEFQRGQGMDNTMSQNLGGYVSQLNSLGIGGTQAAAGLGQTQFGNENSLAQGQYGNESGLAQQQNNAVTNAQVASGTATGNQALNFGNQRNQLNQNFNQTNAANITNNQGASAGIMQQRNQLIQQMRSMGLQDADIQNQLNLQGLNLQNQQFQQGVQGIGLNLNQQNYGASGLGNLGQQQMANSAGWNQNGMNWNNQAFNQYGTDLGVEGQNAGWGAKLIGGAVGAGLNIVAPGMGSMVGGAIAGSGGAGAGGGFTPNYGSGMGYGGYGGGTPGTFGSGNFAGGMFNNPFAQVGYGSMGSNGALSAAASQMPNPFGAQGMQNFGAY